MAERRSVVGYDTPQNPRVSNPGGGSASNQGTHFAP